MKVMVLVKASKDSEAGVMPTQQLLTEMGQFNEELVNAGIMLAGEGLQPSSKGVRVRFSGKERMVIDGPFAETKELVAGYWIWRVKSMEEAIAWLKRCPNPMTEDSEVEIRRIFSPEDFGEAFTPELQQREERLRAEIKSQSSNSGAVVSTERFLSFSPREIFAAFEQPARLAQWWGPKDFTNTFEQFEFKPGGRWVFVMHGPNGANYPNEAVFQEIQADTKIVIGHVSQPRFTLTVTLTARGDKTRLAWVQEFESPEVAARLRPICEPANEQNLDRLQSLLDDVDFADGRSTK
jgi:uncharacterized protein YndB with AHSA1/START domain